MKDNYLTDLFINEAKPALNRHSGSGGGSSGGNIVECESLPTTGVSDDKIYRVRWSETVDRPLTTKIWATVGDGSPPIDGTLLLGIEEIVIVQNTSDIPTELDNVTCYICMEDSEIYLEYGLPVYTVVNIDKDASKGFINSPDDLDVNAMQYGIVITQSESITIEHTNIGLPIVTETTKLYKYNDGQWYGIGLLSTYLNASGSWALANTAISSLDGVLYYSDTSNVKDMTGMFGFCERLTTVPLFDTSNVESMNGMFQNCSSLTTVPLFNTSNVETMSYMFNKCSSLTTVPLFNTSNVETMNYMFDTCSSLNTVPWFNTSNVKDMTGMFGFCERLTTVPLFNTSNVETMNYMFESCVSLSPVPPFDTSNVKSMNGMFKGCTGFNTVPLFNTSNVETMNYMFDGCSFLTTVPQFDMSSVTSANSMFNKCSRLAECRLRNIKTSLTIGSGTSYGHLLTLDSLLHLLGELIDTGFTNRLTIGSANLEKLKNVYVRITTITTEMERNDPYIKDKLPFEVCESSDPYAYDAYSVTSYLAFKNWELA